MTVLVNSSYFRRIYAPEVTAYGSNTLDLYKASGSGVERAEVIVANSSVTTQYTNSDGNMLGQIVVGSNGVTISGCLTVLNGNWSNVSITNIQSNKLVVADNIATFGFNNSANDTPSNNNALKYTAIAFGPNYSNISNSGAPLIEIAMEAKNNPNSNQFMVCFGTSNILSSTKYSDGTSPYISNYDTVTICSNAIQTNFGNITGNLNVGGQGNFTGNVNAANINAGLGNFTGDVIAVNGNFSGNANITGNAIVGGDVTAVNGNFSSYVNADNVNTNYATVNQNLTVTGNILGNVITANFVNVTFDITAQNGNFNDNINVSGFGNFSNDITVAGSGNFGGNVNVTQNGNFLGDVTAVNGNFTNVNAGLGNFTGDVLGANGNFSNVNVTNLLTSNSVNITNLLNANLLAVIGDANLFGAITNITNLFASNATITNLTAGNIVANNVSAGNGNFTNLTTVSLNIEGPASQIPDPDETFYLNNTGNVVTGPAYVLTDSLTNIQMRLIMFADNLSPNNLGVALQRSIGPLGNITDWQTFQTWGFNDPSP